MTTRTKRPRVSVLVALAVLAGAACGADDPLGASDNTPPSLDVLQPTEEAVLGTSRPLFVVRIQDAGSGVFVSTLNVQLDGLNVSQPFINGYNPAQGESRVPGLLELEDGLHTLIVRVADNAGNAATTTVLFTTLSSGGGPPPGET